MINPSLKTCQREFTLSPLFQSNFLWWYSSKTENLLMKCWKKERNRTETIKNFHRFAGNTQGFFFWFCFLFLRRILSLNIYDWRHYWHLQMHFAFETSFCTRTHCKNIMKTFENRGRNACKFWFIRQNRTQIEHRLCCCGEHNYASHVVFSLCSSAMDVCTCTNTLKWI